MTIQGDVSLKTRLLEDYNFQNNYDGISGERLADRLEKIAQIGLTKSNGSNRTGFSKEEQEAINLVKYWMENLGLNVRLDGAGNVFGHLEGKNKELPAVMCGSHVDTVPNGGHFDGVLGVVSALEVLEAWKEQGYTPDRSVEIAVFTDEEGTRFNGGFSGSEAVIGVEDIEEKLKLKDSKGNTFAQVLEEVGLSVEGYIKSKRTLDDIEVFIELHIEQGKVLEKEGLPCGIVTGIAGPCWLEFSFHGEADHAGNTPMRDRCDALVASSEFILEVNRLPGQYSDSAVATVGKQLIEPNGVNVIPGKVTIFVDVRDIFLNTRDALVENIKQVASDISHKYGVTFNSKEISRTSPVPIEEEYLETMEEAVTAKGIRPYRLPSGAGHDAMIIGKQIPISMLFVKSRCGISHNPDEWSDLNDCVEAIHVLKYYIEKI